MACPPFLLLHKSRRPGLRAGTIIPDVALNHMRRGATFFVTTTPVVMGPGAEAGTTPEVVARLQPNTALRRCRHRLCSPPSASRGVSRNLPMNQPIAKRFPTPAIDSLPE